MKVSYKLIGSSEPKQVYIRLRDTLNNVDAQTKTGIYIDSSNFKNGQIVLSKLKRNSLDEDKKETNLINEELKKKESQLLKLKNKVFNAYNNRNEYDVISTKWLSNLLLDNKSEKSKISDRFALFADYYLEIKKTEIVKSTYDNKRATIKKVKLFEKEANKSFLIKDISPFFMDEFIKWSNKRKYNKSTIREDITIIKNICDYAFEKYDKSIHPKLKFVKKLKVLKKEKIKKVYLSFEELAIIKDTEIKDTKLDLAKDWLLISCYTGQRVSDFIRFDVDKIIEIDRDKFLNVAQKKTKTKVLVYLNDIVLDILKKYDNNFPPLYTLKSISTNADHHNRYVKKVCEICGINEIITSSVMNSKTRRKEIKTLPKYNFITSHIGRRSFATNYYLKGISSNKLRVITGHKSEEQFLNYVGIAEIQSAVDLADAMKNIK